MWINFSLFEYYELIYYLKYRLGSQDVKESINVIYLCSLFFIISYVIFHKIVKKFLLKPKISSDKHGAIIDAAYNIVFFLTSTSFLILYHGYFIKNEINTEINEFNPKGKSLLFHKTCDIIKFKILTYILISYNIFSFFKDLFTRDISSAISNFLFVTLLLTSFSNRYENYTVVLTINIGLFHVFTKLLLILTFNTKKSQTMMFRMLAGFKFAAWMYMFLSFLPFQYLLPSLDTNINDSLCLNTVFISWYVFNLWTSPMLRIFYHQLYHLTISDCPGGNSLSRCILLKDSPEFEHQMKLKQAYLDVRLHNQRHILNKLNLSESAASCSSSTAFQTIKCVLSLKRKLKRIRENHKTVQNNN
ncbi:CLUMA_CG004820, isoform A [Clunio marinus]|uniref:CLUMA_CG004820, isoform A n=1 Tax=Clunio marinus TaxID=568069 RepID=A0A1J1HT06_9DIPT|nr:CLUMA_CG004820, isoform A [Clunio marinus]